MVVATVPDTFAVLAEPFRGPVEFLFDERVSERVSGGSLDQAVLVSPRTGRVRVRHGRQSITVDIDGGFRPGLVYRVTLLPVIQDLFNNQLMDPFEVVFSTGGRFNPSAVAGTVWDRVSADGVEGLQVVAVAAGDADTVRHVARTDTAGVYVFRYLPPGEYRVVAFLDRNRDEVVDRMELQGEGAFSLAGTDTLFVDLAVLQPDTTPARLTRASVLDSVTVMLEFDDYLEPESRSDLFGVSLTREETGEAMRVDVFHEHAYVAWVNQLRDSIARADSIEAQQRLEDALEEMPLPGDTGRVEAPPAPLAARAPARSPRTLPPTLPAATGGGPPRGPGAQAELTPDGRPIPSRRLVLRLADSLVVNQPYRLAVVDVVNVNGVGGGGGESPVVREPPPDTASADTLAADSLAVPDTAVGDTAVVPPDTGRVSFSARNGWPFLPSRRR